MEGGSARTASCIGVRGNMAEAFDAHTQLLDPVGVS
jgi:hypothetical protein